MLQLSRTRLFTLGTGAARLFVTATAPVPGIAAWLLVGMVVPAHAHFCVSACGGTGMQCSRMAVALGKGCKLECKATFPADPGARRACTDSCKDQVVDDRAACETVVADCRATCDLTMDEQCADDVCSVALSQCRDLVRSVTRACTKAAGSDGVAIQGCIEPGDAAQGYGRAALEDCLHNMTTGLDACIAGC